MHPPNPQMPGGTLGSGTPKSQKMDIAGFDTSALGFRARKSRRLFSVCHGPACTIASLTFLWGPR